MTMLPLAMLPVAVVPIVVMRPNVQANARRPDDNVRMGLRKRSNGNCAKGDACGQKCFHGNDPFALMPP